MKQNYENEEIFDANISFAKEDGEGKKFKLLNIVKKQPSTPVVKKLNRKEFLKMSPEGALALIINNNMSKRNYQYIRTNALEHNCKLYPTYNQVSIR